MAKRKRMDSLEKAIETALDDGNFISYKAASAFVDDLQHVANRVGELIASQPNRAARLFAAFISACHEKADEVDDSGGNFGMLIDYLFAGWIKASRAAGLESAAIAEFLISWMEEDPYGFCHDLERVVTPLLDKPALNAFVVKIRSKFDAAPVNDYKRRRWGERLKTALAAARNVDAYIGLCEQTELTVKDCKVIAEMYRARRRPGDALAWIDRGLAASGAVVRSSYEAHDLREMKRELQASAGGSADALDSAWAEFTEHPSSFTYAELMRYVSPRQKTAWRGKAMAASENGDFSEQIRLWLEHKEIDRLVARLVAATDDEIENLSHYTTAPAARSLERAHPAVAAKVYRALAMRVVNAGKSKYYDDALNNFEHARKCYAKAGLGEEWDAITLDVRHRHHRKAEFLSRFDRIAAGATKSVRPTLLERAKRRWPS
jgi:uncharacterized Zn finger protein